MQWLSVLSVNLSVPEDGLFLGFVGDNVVLSDIYEEKTWQEILSRHKKKQLFAVWTKSCVFL